MLSRNLSPPLFSSGILAYVEYGCASLTRIVMSCESIFSLINEKNDTRRNVWAISLVSAGQSDISNTIALNENQKI